MNEIRQLCSNSSSSGEHFDEILGLFKACPPQHLLSSLSLIGQSISCMSIEQIDASMINHPLLITIRKWSDRLLQQWLINGMLNAEEYRALFYIDHLFKLINEWLNELDYRSIGENDQKFISVALKNLFLDGNFLQTYSQAIEQLINDEERSLTTAFVNVSHLTVRRKLIVAKFRQLIKEFRVFLWLKSQNKMKRKIFSFSLFDRTMKTSKQKIKIKTTNNNNKNNNN